VPQKSLETHGIIARVYVYDHIIRVQGDIMTKRLLNFRHTHTHTHPHTHTHTRAHTQHTHARAHAHTRTHTRARAHAHTTQTHTHTHIYIYPAPYTYCWLLMNDFDLCNNLAEGRFMFITSTRCIPVKIQWAEMRSCLVWASYLYYAIQNFHLFYFTRKKLN